MMHFLLTAFAILLALTLIGVWADRRAEHGSPTVTPGLARLPGDIKYESPSGNVRVYFPIMTSIVASVVLSLVLWLFR